MTKTTAQRIIGETTLPNGKPGIIIECACRTHGGNGRAMMAADAREGLTANPVRIHGFVTLAWSPIGKLQNVRQNKGPWRIEA